MAFAKGKKKAKAVEETKVEETKVETTEEVVEGIESDEEFDGIQTTFNTDGLDILVAEGEVENVEVYSED